MRTREGEGQEGGRAFLPAALQLLRPAHDFPQREKTAGAQTSWEVHSGCGVTVSQGRRVSVRRKRERGSWRQGGKQKRGWF